MIGLLLIAGTNWNNATNSRSQARNANNYRWNTNSNISCQFSADTGYELYSWLDLLTLSKGKIQNGEIKRLVAKSESHLINKIMRRHGNLYSKICDIDNLRLAYQKARKGKNWQNTIKNFDKNAEENLLRIQKNLINKIFETSEYRTKMIHEPKDRTIYILPFNPDRIVQHALMNVIEPIWEGLFIYNSYACRIGKGIHAGSRKTMEYIRGNRYCLKCDISKFYPSMKHDILFSIIKRKIKCKDTLWLLHNIIYSIGSGKNIPIGNYTSQWFGNLYMNELDQYIKHVFKIKHYIRYCDDFILFHDDKKYLRELAKKINKYYTFT